MPFRSFLNGEQFDQETVRILGVAFTQVSVALRIGDCDNDVKQAIANKIIELAKTGERIMQPGLRRACRWPQQAEAPSTSD